MKFLDISGLLIFYEKIRLLINNYFKKSGGEITGKTIISYDNNEDSLLDINSNDGTTCHIRLKSNGKTVGSIVGNHTTRGTALYNAESGVFLGIKNDGTPHVDGKEIALYDNITNIKSIRLTDEDLNDIKKYGSYFAGGDNTCSNKPNVSWFNLQVICVEGTTYRYQILIGNNIYSRLYNGETWSNWTKLAYITDTVATAEKFINKELTTEDLNDIKDNTFCCYFARGGNSVKNKPNNVDNFGLQSYKMSDKSRYCQIITSNTGILYKRYYAGSWTNWYKIITESDISNTPGNTTIPITNIYGTLSSNGLSMLSKQTVIKEEGWYRLYVSNNARDNVIVMINRSHSGEAFTLSCNCTLGLISITQLSGHLYSKPMADKIRAGFINNITDFNLYIDIHINDTISISSNGTVYETMCIGHGLSINLTKLDDDISYNIMKEFKLSTGLRNSDDGLISDKLLSNRLTNEDLNDIKDINISNYYAVGSNSVKNKPDGVNFFNLTTYMESIGYYVLILTSMGNFYFRRTGHNSEYGEWYNILTSNLPKCSKALTITAVSGNQYLIMGNQDSVGVNKPSIIKCSNGNIAFGYGDSWETSNGGTFTLAAEFNNGDLYLNNNLLTKSGINLNTLNNLVNTLNTKITLLENDIKLLKENINN